MSELEHVVPEADHVSKAHKAHRMWTLLKCQAMQTWPSKSPLHRCTHD